MKLILFIYILYLSEIFGAIDRSWTESTDTVHKINVSYFSEVVALANESLS
jgi:hypothetical protein